jgi:hypothetical protein
MLKLNRFSDVRLMGSCVFCGGPNESKDHIPSKIFLDSPFPSDLHSVEACKSCNQSFSGDEEYMACLIEAVICGSVESENLQRDKIKKILDAKPSLKESLGRSMELAGEDVFFRPEYERITNIVLKTALGHAAYESSELNFRFKPFIAIQVIHLMNDEQRTAFETPIAAEALPEIGSRSFQRAIQHGTGWVVVQEGRYRFLMHNDFSGCTVKMVFSDYLAAEVSWLYAEWSG